MNVCVSFLRDGPGVTHRAKTTRPYIRSTVIPVAVAHAIRRPLASASPATRLMASPSARKLPLAPLNRPLTITPHAYISATRHFRASRSPIVAPTLISQMTLQVPVAIYGPPFRHRACVRYSIIRRFYCTYDSHGTARMAPNPGTVLKSRYLAPSGED